jgi:hypothetical protein
MTGKISSQLAIYSHSNFKSRGYQFWPIMEHSAEADAGLTIVPVFCTADIPTTVCLQSTFCLSDICLYLVLQTLDLFITRAEEYADEYDFVPRVLDSADASSIQDIKGRSKAPISGFTTPFEGMTILEVNNMFVSQVMPLEQFSYALFVVLDKRSTEDETCLVVRGGTDFDEDNEMHTLRTDFYVPMVFACQAELGVADLGENLDRNEVWGLHNLNTNSI